MSWSPSGGHVTRPDFGLGMDSTEFYTRFLDYFSGLKNRDEPIDGYTMEYLLREAYMTIFDIVDLGNREDPLAMVTYTNADTLGDIGPIAELIQGYRSDEILDKYGLSIKEYFEMPLNVAKLLVSNAKTEKEDTKDILQSAKTTAENEYKKKNR